MGTYTTAKHRLLERRKRAAALSQKLCEKEGVPVGILFAPLFLGAADAVAGVFREVEQDGIRAGGGGFQACARFGGEERVDTRIIDAALEQDRRIRSIVLHFLISVHPHQCPESFLGFNGAELGGIEHAVSGGFGAQGIGHGDNHDQGFEEIRALG